MDPARYLLKTTQSGYIGFVDKPFLSPPAEKIPVKPAIMLIEPASPGPNPRSPEKIGLLYQSLLAYGLLFAKPSQPFGQWLSRRSPHLFDAAQLQLRVSRGITPPSFEVQ
jgi:hypothetical protein